MLDSIYAVIYTIYVCSTELHCFQGTQYHMQNNWKITDTFFGDGQALPHFLSSLLPFL